MSSKKRKRRQGKKHNINAQTNRSAAKSQSSSSIRSVLQSKQPTMAKKLPTILLEIASYCDPQLMKTVNSALIQADHPERIHFAICHQDDSMTDFFTLKKYRNMKIKHLSTKNSKGSCYARYICQQMLDDEDFVMHTDSHMRFVKHWDTLIIKQWESFNDPNAIISVYPPNCNVAEMMSYPLDHETFDKPCNGGFMFAIKFRDMTTASIKFCSRYITQNEFSDMSGRLNAFMAAGYFFAPAQADRDVLVDPNMMFIGDELPVAIRLFTHGYNFRNPNECYAYHEYCRPNRKFPSNMQHQNQNEIKRMLTLINEMPETEKVDLGEFGLGTKRTLQDYINFSGIDFRNRTIHENAERGVFDEPKYRNAMTWVQSQYSQKYNFTKNGTITVIVTCLSNDRDKIIDLIQNCNDTVWRNKPYFIFSIADANLYYDMKAHNPDPEHISFVSLFSSRYGKLLQSGINEAKRLHWSDYVLCIDDNVRFINNWDMYMLSCLYDVGSENILTEWCYTYASDKSLLDANVYCNKVLAITGMNWPYPKYQLENLKQGNVMNSSHLLSNSNLIFGKLDTLISVPINEKFGFAGHNYVYSMMLWTHGHTIYYPPNSYFIRLNNPPMDDKNAHERPFIQYLMRDVGDSTRYLNWPYKPGKARTVEQWLNELGINYELKKFAEFNKPNT